LGWDDFGIRRLAGSGGAVLYGHTAIQSQDLALSKRALMKVIEEYHGK
jgi:hypothetical protein